MDTYYYNEKDAAKFLALASTTLSRWRWAKKGPRATKFHGAVRYSLADLEAFADAGKVAS